jgi:SAM-dependent methyltransferase
LLARNVYISDHNHAYVDLTRPIVHQGIGKVSPVFIGRNTWLGQNVSVLPGVTIGEHCIIGANSVVRSSIPSYSVAVGAPARVVKQVNRKTGQWERTPFDVPDSSTNGRLRLLVTIASFGDKNLSYLKELIRTYRTMDMDVDIFVVSDSEKDLGPGVTVIVGLPGSNPWALPFAHKAVLATRVEHYDLFIYSEDDMGVTENNIQAFLRASPHLAPDEIAGFLRYEIDLSGGWSLPELHGPFHWHPDSVRKRDGLLVAQFSNEHAGFYLITQAQLRQCIASGGFLKGPYRDRYGLPETAATDVYTSCGFRKVICISDFENFLIHHQSNRYVGHLGLSLSAFREQIKTLINISNDQHPTATLCEVESKLDLKHLSKSLYEPSCKDLLELIPADAQTILSVGCGWGALEAELIKRGSKVTALPLDSVVGASVAQLGVKVIYGTLQESLMKIEAQTFDCVLIVNLLHLLPDPYSILDRCGKLVGLSGTIVLKGPNFEAVSTRVKCKLGVDDYGMLPIFARSGIFPCGPNSLRGTLVKGGLKVELIRWLRSEVRQKQRSFSIPILDGKMSAVSWIVRARR